MKLAVLYVGQGAQHPGMGKEFYEASSAFRAAFDAADLPFDLHRVCFDDPDGVLNQTEYTQPCMVAFACGVSAVLAEQGVKPAYVAGLSLGEYSALEAAGVFTAKQAIELAAYRGKAMADAASGIDCGMTAVLNLDRVPLAECCEQASALGCVQICNYNCPGQLVIGGEKAAVDKAAELAKQAGARRCIPLKVSGPFHTRLMAPAGDALAKRFAAEPFGEMSVPVLFNCLGHEMEETDTIAALLEKQVQSGVRWEVTVRRLAELGVDAAIVSDIGVLMAAHRAVPELELHISTQAGVTNWLTATELHRLGAKRVVLARELPLTEIEELCRRIPRELEVEVFVHGAMCISYSGRCLLSQYLTGRDANRGACTQPCRWKYALMEEKRPGQYYPVEEDGHYSYILNAKDLCLIEYLDKLAKAGVHSFKIEGRAKSAYYTAVTAGAYRTAARTGCGRK